jgi:hypothetical protein
MSGAVSATRRSRPRASPRAGDDEPLEWTGRAALDATDVGEQLGMLFDVEAARRRAGVLAAIQRVDLPAP